MEENWHRALALINANPTLTIFVIGGLLLIDLSAFARAYGQFSVLAITLALIATTFLLPYVLNVYPFPHTPTFYKNSCANHEGYQKLSSASFRGSPSNC